MFKRNKDRAELFLDVLKQNLLKGGFPPELIERAEAAGLEKHFDTTSQLNRFGISILFYKYFVELEDEWREFICTVRNGFF